MPTRRHAIKRAQRRQIDAAVLEAFKHWQATDDEAPLAKALGCKPWEIPVARPDQLCPWPSGAVSYTQWPEAQERFHLLTTAAAA